MNRGKRKKMAELEAENWNLKHGVGTAVKVRKDNDAFVYTVTASDAYATSAGNAVVFLDGVSSYCHLDRVSANEATQ